MNLLCEDLVEIRGLLCYLSIFVSLKTEKPAPAPTETGKYQSEDRYPNSQSYCIIFGAAMQSEHIFDGCYFYT